VDIQGDSGPAFSDLEDGFDLELDGQAELSEILSSVTKELGCLLGSRYLFVA
jgi:hypothetical protein